MCRALERGTGISYRINGVITNSDGLTEYTLVPCDRHIRSKLEEVWEKQSIKGIPIEKFCIVTDNEKLPVMITNEIQVEILHNLEIRPQSLKMLKDRTGRSLSTLFINLQKLEEIGVISSERESPEPIMYKNTGIMVISDKPGNNADSSMMGRLITVAANNPAEYFTSMSRYLLVMFDVMGLDTRSSMLMAGRCAADSDPELLKVDSMEEILTKIFGLVHTSTLGVKTYIPLTITMETDLMMGIGRESLLQFYVGMITELILHKTGKQYYMSSLIEVAAPPLSKYEFVLESTGYSPEPRICD